MFRLKLELRLEGIIGMSTRGGYMFTVKATFPHSRKTKFYAFNNPRQAERFADSLQAVRVAVSLGVTKMIDFCIDDHVHRIIGA